MLWFILSFLAALAVASHDARVKKFFSGLSVIIGLIYGGVIFKEKNLAARTIGTLLLVAGAGVITLWGR